METECISRCHSPKQLSDKSDELVDLEFDGNTVLCRVCGDRASGFHYGVHACEGCKGFFRRSIQQKIQYRPCLKNQLCLITRVNRNRCQYCRLKKCIAVGMSRDAVRFGRVPKREKAKIMEQMQKVNTQCHGSMLDALLSDESEFARQIIDAHMKTCSFTRSNFERFFRDAWSRHDVVHCPAHMACPLNPFPNDQEGAHRWDQFSDCFMPAIRNVVGFAKGIPGFSVLSQEDQVTLLKAGTFEVLLVHLACLFDSKNGTMFFTNGKIFKRTSISFNTGAGYLLDSMFDFAERFNALNLVDEEIALFSSLVVVSSDRPGLRGVDLVEKLQSTITRCLQTLMKLNHAEDLSVFAKLLVKVSELRMLNTVHSEKLLGLTVPVVDLHGPALTGPSRHSSSNRMHLCSGEERGGGGGCDCPRKNTVDLRGRPFESNHRFDKESIYNSSDVRGEGGGGGAIDLRGRASSMIGRGSLSWHVGSQTGRACDEFEGSVRSDERQFLRNPGHGESDWSIVERLKRSAVREKTSSSLPRPPSPTRDTSAGSLVARHQTGASIVARQVTMKRTMQQELVLTTPVGIFHRTPLNFWSTANSDVAATTTPSSGVRQRLTEEEGFQADAAKNGEVGGELETWKRRKQMMTDYERWDTMETCKKKTSEKSVIPATRQVMRTWSEDADSSKLSSSCHSNSDTSAESFPAKSVASSGESVYVDVLRVEPPAKTDERDSSASDLPVLKRTLSSCHFCPSDRSTERSCVVVGDRCHETESGCRSSSADGRRDLAAFVPPENGFRDPRDPFCGKNAGSFVRRRQHDRAMPFANADDRLLDDEAIPKSYSFGIGCSRYDMLTNDVVGRRGQPRLQSSSSFAAENLLRTMDDDNDDRPMGSRTNRSERADAVVDQAAAALPSTMAILKDRLMRRIDSRDNVNVDTVASCRNDSMTRGERRVAAEMLSMPGLDLICPSSSSSYPLSFLADYPRYYPPLGYSTGLHPGVQLYNRLAFHHLQALQHQQHLQAAQARLTLAACGTLPGGADWSGRDGAVKSVSAAGSPMAPPSTGSERLSIDESSDCEETKHLNMQPENLTQSPVLVKSELR